MNEGCVKIARYHDLAVRVGDVGVVVPGRRHEDVAELRRRGVIATQERHGRGLVAVEALVGKKLIN